MNKKTILFSTIILSLVLLFTGCKKEENQSTLISGEVEVSEEDLKKEAESKDKAEINAGEQYDFRNLPVPEPINPAAIIDSSTSFVGEYNSAASNSDEDDEPIPVTTIYSYYARKLSQRSQLAYREILVAALNGQENVAITKPVSKNELEKIMNIIFLDTPEAFMLEHEYEYTIDSTEKVSSVNLFYCMSPTSLRDKYNNYIKGVVDLAEGVKKSENTVEGISSLMKKLGFSLKFELSDSIGERDYTALGVLPSSKSLESNTLYFLKGSLPIAKQNYIASSKTYVAILREAGVDACVKVGTLLNPKHYLKNDNYHVEKPIEFENMITESRSNGVTHVKCNFNSLYSWVAVKVNKQWYNIDPYFFDFFNIKLDTSLLDKLTESGPMFLVDDYLMSQSRIFYINDLLLGRSEPSTGRTFQPLYREGKYVPVQDANKLTDLMDYMVEKMSESNTKGLYYQFGSRENFSDFVKRFDERVSLFNRQYKNPIRSYKLYSNEELLIVAVHEIVKKDVMQK